MSYKTIHLTVPKEFIFNDEFSPEENAMIWKIGSDALLEGRKVISGLTQKEIYEQIKEDKREEIQKLEMRIIMEKEMGQKMLDRIKEEYETRMKDSKWDIETMKEKMESLKEKLKMYENENKEIIRMEIDKERDKFFLLLKEKDLQNKCYRDTMEKMQDSLQQLTTVKSNFKKGIDGEKKVGDLLEDTFRDYNGFELKDKHTQASQGDFHILFEEFDILVDAKNYSKKVDKSQRDKIKCDLLKNENMSFAWLISLNTNIEKYDKAPVTFEWINIKQCIIYINKLLEYEDPNKLFRIVWNMCKELYKIIKYKTEGAEEVNEYKEINFKTADGLKNISKHMKEIKMNINQLNRIYHIMEEELRIILEISTQNIIDSHFCIFDEWWTENIEYVMDETTESNILSTELWNHFKKYNKDTMKQIDISIEKFKQFIKTKVDIMQLVINGKHQSKSAFSIKGIKWREHNKKDEKVQEIIEKEEGNKEIKTKTIKKSYYFDEKLDKQILEDYKDESKNIMNIREKHNVQTFQVVSVLMKHKIISSRDMSRGYDLYKETDEYKNKIATA
jgi:hypothetical protein